MISAFLMDEVRQNEAYCVNALNKEVSYLKSFDADRLLAGFRETAGLDTKGAKRYGGWENMLIGGHTLGHYLTAVSQAYVNPGADENDRKALFEKISYLIDELLVCQENSKGKKGFIFGATFVDDSGKRCDGIRREDGGIINVEAQFDRVEKAKTNIITESWVPWYTMHKLFAGLISVYELISRHNGNGQAGESTAAADREKETDLAGKTLRLLKGMGDWTCDRAFSWSEETRRTVVSIEYGGMNEVLYELYAITGDDRYCLAADKFDEPVLYDNVASGDKDVLNNHHANTTIPKFIGALNRYVTVNGRTVNGRLRDETRYLKYAEAFWDMVVERHTYVTGGNSEWEHFGNDFILNAERTACNNETCNVYNMLKLSRGLFMVTGKKKYLDYYENTFYNSILSSQNPESGMTTYFQPMASGYFKTYGEPFTKFWCCTGSGMENFTKLNDSLYFYDDSEIYVNMYFDSELTSGKHDLKLTMNSCLPYAGSVKVRLEALDGSGKMGCKKLLFRLPDWAADKEKTVSSIKLSNDASAPENRVKAGISGDWIAVEGELLSGDEISFEFGMKLTAVGLPDDDRVFALKYGPMVLSADLGREEMSTTVTGVDVTVPARKLENRDTIVLPKDVTREKFVNEPEVCFIAKAEDACKTKDAEDRAGAGEKAVASEGTPETGKCAVPEFTTNGPGSGKLVFSPHFLRYRERYGIYFYYLTEEEADKASEEGLLGSGETVDTVMPGYGQYENDELHDMKESDTVSVTSGATYRFAKAGGAFSYRLAVDKNRKNRISMMLRMCDNRKPLKISADGEVIYDEVLAYRKTDQYYRLELDLPESIVSKAERITANGTEYDVVRIAFSGTADADSAAVCDYVRVSAF